MVLEIWLFSQKVVLGIITNVTKATALGIQLLSHKAGF